MTKTLHADQATAADASRIASDGYAVQSRESQCNTEGQSNLQPNDARVEAIRTLAHSKWEAAGCPSGDGFDFWLEAEREIDAKGSGSTAAQ